jgi:hypothetical protein
MSNTNDALHSLKLSAGYLSADQHSAIASCVTQINSFAREAQQLRARFDDLINPDNANYVRA